MAPQELLENFALFDDWEDKYAYLIDLGKKLPPMPAQDKVDANKVRGCTSQVWLTHRAEAGVHHFVCDSDAHIVRGLLAILMVLYNQKPQKDIMATDAEAFFAQLGLASHLSPNRRNGFASMVNRLKMLAASPKP